MILWVTLALVPRYILGLFLVGWLLPRSVVGRLPRLLVAGPLGIGVSSLLGFLWIWIGLSLRSYVILEAAAVLAAGLWAVWRHRARLLEVLRTAREPALQRPKALVVLLVAAIVLAGASFVHTVQLKPHGGWDAWNNWNVVSRFIYAGGADWDRTFLREWDQPGYPLLLPMANASTWTMLRTETTRAPMILGLFFSATLAALLFAFVRELRGGQQAALATLALLSVWSMIRTGAEQYADVPLAAFFLVSAGMLAIEARSPHRSLAFIAGLAAGLAAWTKDEGQVFAWIAALPWISMGGGRGGHLKAYALGAAGPLIVVIAFKTFLAPPSYLFFELADRLRTADAAGLLGRIQLMPANLVAGDWTIVISGAVLLLYAAAMFPTGKSVSSALPVLIVTALQGFAYIVIYIITPFRPGWHISTSIGRLYLHLLPLILLSVFLWLRTPEQLGRAQGRVLHAPDD